MSNKVKWSGKQLDAIELRDKNLLVSASAGSGKTSVMIARIIDLIEKDNAQLDKMLISTFTRASALDMKEKLYEKLLEKRNESADPKKYDEQISLIPIADISTIDSWCVKLVRNYFYAIDVDPGFEILDDLESDAMLMIAIDTALNQFLNSANNEDFLVLYESMYHRRSDRTFRELISKVYEFAMTQSNPEEWLKNSLNYYDGSYAKVRDEMYAEEKQGLLAECDEMINTLSAIGATKAKEKMQAFAFSLQADEKPSSLSYADTDPFVRTKMEKLRDKGNAFIAKIADLSNEPINSAYAKQIVEFTLAVKKAFEEEKAKKAVMDFSDCEHKAYELLCKEDILEDVKKKYDYVFVDEYQDTNPLQEAIVSKLKKGGNMFYVGDIKQSIYAFRNCDPKIFKDHYDNYESYGFAEPIDFVTNYRCGQKIIDFVNEVFVPLMTKNFGGIDYSKYMLQGFEKTKEGEVKATIFKPVEKAGAVDCDYDIYNKNDVSNVEKLSYTIAEDIAKTIDKIKKKKEEEKKKENKKKEEDESIFSNIAVLTPTRNPLAGKLYEMLNQLGIPTHMTKELYFSSNPTIRYILDILAFINDNENDVAFVSAITSSFFNITPSEILTFSKNSKKKYSIASSARWYASNNDDELSQKLKYVFEFFDKYYNYSMFMPVKDTVSKIIVELDYFDKIIRDKGIKEADMLTMFLDSLNSCPYADTIESYLKYVNDGGDKCEIKPDSDCINIMTIHASKGLEFPYVYFIGSETQNKHNSSLCLTDKQLGLGIKTLNTNDKMYEENALYSLMKEISEKKLLEEKARLLYVALTRAKEGLYIYASAEKTKNSIYDGYPIDSDTMLGWMSEAIIKLPFKTVDGADVEFNGIHNKNIYNSSDVIKLADEEFVTALQARFDKMKEVYASMSNDLLKTSVTQIASEWAESDSEQLPQVDEERAYKPKSKEDPIKKGNAYHKTMELLDFNLDFEDAYSKVESAGIADFELVKKEKIHLAYNAVKPLLENGKAYKEKSFIYNEGSRLVQGIIDLLIIRDGVATVVDYKTTSAYSLSQEKTMLEYEKQIAFYAKAASEIIGLKVDKVELYSFEKDSFIDPEEELKKIIRIE